ncbi:MAG TPA: hypothetical protein V6C65_41555, partial [Allocoleopsis sp.]
MIDPLFWLGFSLLLVAVSLTAVLIVALPALQELARAARSAEKLFDTLNRELPPTLEALRLTGLEISDLTDDMSEGVQHAGRVVQQLDQSMSGVKQQAKQAQVVTSSVLSGFQAAWKVFTRPTPARPSPQRNSHRSHPSGSRSAYPYELDQLDQREFEQAALDSDDADEFQHLESDRQPAPSRLATPS